MQTDYLRAEALIRSARNLLIPGSEFQNIERVAEALKRSAPLGAAGLRRLKVRVLSNITTDYLADHLRLMLLRDGFDPDLQPGQYGGLIKGMMGDVDLAVSTCDAAIIVLTHRDIQYPPPLGANHNQAREQVIREADFWMPLFERSTVPTVILSFDAPAHRILDEQDALSPGGLSWHVQMTNLEIASRLKNSIALVDAAALQFRVGSQNWYDSRLYHLCKQPYAMEALPEVAHTLVSALTGLLGRGRKVLALDLDNTLWGGVVGDDGLQNLDLGPETAEGEAFVSFQNYIRKLSQRGIVLAVCSKNRDEVARLPFREHTGMVLKESDIACFVANFQDKASNLRHIAKQLNLGLDSFVFVDDNPVERALIRSELPEVLVVELPEEPAYYAHALETSKAFPLRALTSEDLGRGASYQAMSALREVSSGPGTDMEQFLIGLEPVAHVEKINESTIDRIVQLIRKTNQFKLNQSTFQESAILAESHHVLALRLADRLQDYGIVAVAVARPEAGSLSIRNWVMSCRVFGRRLEHVMIELLRSLARDTDCWDIRGEYMATEKNVILPDILNGLGFTAAGSSPVIYKRPVGIELSEPHHVQIKDNR